MNTRPQLHASWLQLLEAEFSKVYMLQLKEFIREEKKAASIYPPSALVFNAFNSTPFSEVRVVILGQDPYHGPGQAHGLCFSVPEGVSKPPSLLNIFKEIERDLKLPIPECGNLQPWTRQGVFLLNTLLTVREHSPLSHAKRGWEIFTDKVIQLLNDEREGLVFVLWGANARSKITLLDKNKHFILEAPHPSPLSAHRGFMGCGHFSKINSYLKNRGHETIDWGIP